MAATMLTVAATSAQLAPISTSTRFQFATRTRLPARLPARRMVCTVSPSKGGSSGPAINAGDKVTEKIEDAQEICAGDTQSEDCATAWNEVEAAKVKKQQTKGDPLEEFCEEYPETDECRTYTD